VASRSEQKQKTRRALLDAALGLLSIERVFSSLSLREVTRAAGIAPTSFYRHFEDMNDLGIALVEESGLALRQLLRKARTRIVGEGSAIDISVDTFMEYITNSPNHFRLLIREHSGNSEEFRHAINIEIKHFVTELEQYLITRSNKQLEPEIESEAELSPKFTNIVSEGMVIIVFHLGGISLDVPKREREIFSQRAKVQLRMLLIGANRLT